MTPEIHTKASALLELLKGHGRAQVCTLEPEDCRAAALVLAELLALNEELVIMVEGLWAEQLRLKNPDATTCPVCGSGPGGAS